MNISHEHKTIWWAPERAGTKITREVLWDFDFMTYNPKFEHDELPLKLRYQSHFNEIPEEFSNYKLICNVRNPYSRVFGLFLFTQYKDVVIDKFMHNFIKERFDNFILEYFVKEKTSINLSKITQTKNVDLNYFSKWTFKSRIPDYFLRVENLSEDLYNLEFIKSNPDWNLESVRQKVENNRFITNKPLKFDEVYNFETAKRVYFYYKKVFHSVGYNPFSFTKENLSDNEKRSFLHDIL